MFCFLPLSYNFSIVLADTTEQIVLSLITKRVKNSTDFAVKLLVSENLMNAERTTGAAGLMTLGMAGLMAMGVANIMIFSVGGGKDHQKLIAQPNN